MSAKIVLILFSLVFIAVITDASRFNLKTLPLGDYYYFYGPAQAINREAAVQYCNDEGGELATLTTNTLFTILIRDLPEEAVYWIDGMAGNAREQFSVTEGCPTEKHLEEIQDDKLDLGTAANCLTVVKGANLANSKIKAESCSSTTPTRVICQIRVNGECATEAPTTVATVTA